jgi:hypothetical protein
MKSSHWKNIASVLTAMVAASSVYAGSVASVTLRLTESATEEALLAKDANGKVLPEKISTFDNEFQVATASQETYTYEYASKIVAYKISNKEFLEALRDEVGLIDDIRGWSLVFVAEGEEDGIAYISKKGTEAIDVSQYLYGATGEEIAIQDTYKYVLTEVFSTEKTTLKETGAYKSKELIAVTAEFPSSTIIVYGTLESSGRLQTFGTGELQYSEYIPGAGNMKNLAGTAEYENGDDPSIVEGSISVAAGKTVDLAAFFAGL